MPDADNLSVLHVFYMFYSSNKSSGFWKLHKVVVFFFLSFLTIKLWRRGGRCLNNKRLPVAAVMDGGAAALWFMGLDVAAAESAAQKKKKRNSLQRRSLWFLARYQTNSERCKSSQTNNLYSLSPPPHRTLYLLMHFTPGETLILYWYCHY